MSKRKAAEQAVAVAPASPSSSPGPEERKRKRKEDGIPDDEKLEIDVSLPEPPSKKAKRAEKKKTKTKKSSTSATDAAAKVVAVIGEGEDNADPESLGIKPDAASSQPARSEYGIWIGNLPWSATRDSLRQFLKDEGKVWEREIVRVHMPAPFVDRSDSRPNKPQNKGFAYVDFTTQEVLDRALALSEKLMTGRRVLIKNAKSFEGRPDKAAAKATDGESKGGFVSKKEPAKRIFVGNLSFDVTQEDLMEHFGQAGEIEDIHMATFEDSGKCKGFAWVRFKEIDAAEAAVRGFVYKKADDDEEAGEDGESSAEDDKAADGKKKPKVKRHKQHINRLQGRELRREFAEDAQTRYKKRYGKKDDDDATNTRKPAGDRRDTTAHDGAGLEGTFKGEPGYTGDGGKKRHEKDQRRKERRKRHDARTVAPGQALANAPRSSGAIVAGSGKKVTFD
ncbi:hypothetical protein LTR85_005971 [Meristemomyces frigidus]|nr:hypothetical protein LTR85_005971 [Meristemomyces frigidus]